MDIYLLKYIAEFPLILVLIFRIYYIIDSFITSNYFKVAKHIELHAVNPQLTCITQLKTNYQLNKKPICEFIN